MIHLGYNKNDLRYIFCWGDNIRANTKKEKEQGRVSLEEHLNKIPEYMWLPSYSGVKKPEVFLNKFVRGDKVIYYCFAGLWKNIIDWCDKNEITYQWETDETYFKYYDMQMTLKEFTDYVNSWGLSLEPRPYQYKAAWLILKYRVSMSQLATRAGKTLIAYMVFRYMLEHGAHNILMIVPNTSLVKQGVKDMSEYQEFFKSETVWSKGELCESANLTIGTFQSLVLKLDRKSKRYDPKFFKKFDVICCDECHTVKCQSIKTLLNQDCMKNVKIRFGFSGTVPDGNNIEAYTCQALLGPLLQDIRSSELVNEGFLAKVDVTQLQLEYKENEALINEYIRCGEYLCSNTVKDKDGKEVQLPKDQQDFTMKYAKKMPFALEQVKQMYEPREYMEYLIDCCKANGSNLLMLEQMVVHHSKKRIAVIDKLVCDLNKNIIVFAHHSNYLTYIYEHLKEEFPDKNVYLIKGSTPQKKRDKIMEELNGKNNCILCASYACCGTGLTFKNLYYGIFAQSFRSKTINLQSIGRGMLKTDDKDTFYLYDIVDCLPSGKLSDQGREKRNLYKKEKYTVHVKPAEY
jgi:superfamily II DNA or RNA helicase